MRKNMKMKAGSEIRTPHAGSCEMAVGPAVMVIGLAEEEVGVEEIAEDEAEEEELAEDEAEEEELVLLVPDADVNVAMSVANVPSKPVANTSVISEPALV